MADDLLFYAKNEVKHLLMTSLIPSEILKVKIITINTIITTTEMSRIREEQRAWIKQGKRL
ncbi:hypothetical protein QNH39_14650 [Neobacillus novalis]|uniref:Uncharacterized protein n=1 Tax=Neobacillus novalis TaxID=220687 RepID=A0AA95MHU4_9BACI|nr:hypothetical protein [Neobacillus novalis]WHY83926.1 hypothetical protein QNH39_14650 [Neobacillus novalis]